MRRKRVVWRSEVACALALVGLLGLAGTVEAQRSFTVGVQSGAVSSNIRAHFQCPPEPDGLACPTRATGNDSRSGFAAGLFAHRRIKSVLGVQAEAMYTQKGFETTQPTIHADYLELPLLLHLDSDPVTRFPVAVHAVAGVAPSVRARCKVFANTATGFRRERCGDRDYFGDRNSPARFELGFVRGAGVRVSVARFDAGFEWRVVTSVTDIGVWNGDPSENRTSSLIFRLSHPLGSRE